VGCLLSGCDIQWAVGRAGSIAQPDIKIKYFEVTILSFDGSVCVGLATLGSSLGGLQFGIDSHGDLIMENRNESNYYVGRPLVCE